MVCRAGSRAPSSSCDTAGLFFRATSKDTATSLDNRRPRVDALLVIALDKVVNGVFPGFKERSGSALDHPPHLLRIGDLQCPIPCCVAESKAPRVWYVMREASSSCGAPKVSL